MNTFEALSPKHPFRLEHPSRAAHYDMVRFEPGREWGDHPGGRYLGKVVRSFTRLKDMKIVVELEGGDRERFLQLVEEERSDVGSQ